MPQSLTDEKLALVQVINGFVPPNNEPLRANVDTDLWIIQCVYPFKWWDD